jgi:hypothetical protein
MFFVQLQFCPFKCELVQSIVILSLLSQALLWPNVSINRHDWEDWTLASENGCVDADAVRRQMALYGKYGDHLRIPIVSVVCLQ